MALADAASVECTSCGADVAIPQAHRDAFAQMRRDDATRAEANALYAKLGAPPRLLRAFGVMFDPSGVMKPLTGSHHVLVRGIGIYYRWVLIVFAPFVMAVIGMIAILLAMRAIGAHYDANVIETLPTSTRDWIEVPVPIAFALVGSALGVYGRRKAISRHALQAALAAKPPKHDGGPSTCRACGAPLSVTGDALGVRCVYCGADNLVALPQAWIGQLGERTAKVDKEITVANAELSRAQAKAKRSLWLRVGGVAVAFGVLIAISLATGSDDPITDRVPPSWSAFASDPRPLVERIDRTRIRTVAMDKCPVTIATPHTECANDSCTVRLYAALRHGETAELTLDPPAHVHVEEHTGYPWPKTPGGRFGDDVVDITAKSVKLEVKWSSWHEIAITVPAATNSLSLCFAVHHP